MNDYLDEICLLILCCIVAVTQTGGAFIVAGFLLALIIICCESLNKAVIRIGIQLIFIIVSCFSIDFIAFLPIATYAAIHEYPWVVRFLWILPLCFQATKIGVTIGTTSMLWICALCAVALIMAVKNIRSISEHASLQQAYDTRREQMLLMSENMKKQNGSANSAKEWHAAGSSETPGAHGASGVPGRLNMPGMPSASINSDHYEPAFFEGLTKRELAVVNLVAEGMDNREISQKLFLSEGTVRNHISSILAKKGLQNRTQIAVMYYRG